MLYSFMYKNTWYCVTPPINTLYLYQSVINRTNKYVIFLYVKIARLDVVTKICMLIKSYNKQCQKISLFTILHDVMSPN